MVKEKKETSEVSHKLELLRYVTNFCDQRISEIERLRNENVKLKNENEQLKITIKHLGKEIFKVCKNLNELEDKFNFFEKKYISKTE